MSYLDYRLTHGTIWRRILAFLLDGIIVVLVLKALAVALFVLGIVTLGLGMPLLALLPAVPFCYNWLSLLTGLSATPGQALMGLVVVRDADLGPPGPLAALIWVIGFYASLALFGLPFLFALLTARRRTGHDLVSGLVVVRATPLREALTPAAASWNMPPGGPRYR